MRDGDAWKSSRDVGGVGWNSASGLDGCCSVPVVLWFQYSRSNELQS